MDKSATYSLWLEPTGDIAYKLQQRINELSKKYDTPVFSPHVTLVGGLTASQTELKALTDTLASSVKPFSLKLSRAGYLNTYYQSLFIYVEQNDGLSHLHSNACSLFDCPDEYKDKYMPHLSLLYGDLTREQKEKILNNIGREFYIEFPVKKVMLMHTDGQPNQWEKIHTAMFKQR